MGGVNSALVLKMTGRGAPGIRGRGVMRGGRGKNGYTVCPKENVPALQCHIFTNIEFDVFKFSTVI